MVEVDVDPSAYEKGHIEGAVGWNWRKDLQDPDRDVPEPDRPDPDHDEKQGDSRGRR